MTSTTDVIIAVQILGDLNIDELAEALTTRVGIGRSERGEWFYYTPFRSIPAPTLDAHSHLIVGAVDHLTDRKVLTTFLRSYLLKWSNGSGRVEKADVWLIGEHDS